MWWILLIQLAIQLLTWLNKNGNTLTAKEREKVAEFMGIADKIKNIGQTYGIVAKE